MKKIYSLYWVYGVFIFAVSAILKISVASGEELWLSVSDPVFPCFTVRMVMIVVSMIELITCVIAITSSNMLFRYALISSLSGIILTYRFYKWMVRGSGPCNCLGSLPNAVGLTMQNGDVISALLALTMFIGGWICFLHFWKDKKNAMEMTKPQLENQSVKDKAFNF